MFLCLLKCRMPYLANITATRSNRLIEDLAIDPRVAEIVEQLEVIALDSIDCEPGQALQCAL